MVVAEVALIGADWREIGDAIVASVVVFCAAVGRTKQHPKDAHVDKIGYMAQDIFGTVMYDFLSSAPPVYHVFLSCLIGRSNRGGPNLFSREPSDEEGPPYLVQAAPDMVHPLAGKAKARAAAHRCLASTAVSQLAG